MCAFINMMDPDMSVFVRFCSKDGLAGLPHKIIRPGVFMLLIRTKRTNVAKIVVDDKLMPNLLIPALKTLAANAPRAPFNRAEEGAILGMHIGMRAITR